MNQKGIEKPAHKKEYYYGKQLLEYNPEVSNNTL